MKRVNTASSTSQAHIRRMRREANQNVEVANLSQFEVERDINSICEPEEHGLVLNNLPFVDCESFHDVDGDNVDDPNHVDFSLNDVNNRDLTLSDRGSTLSESDPELNDDFDYIDDSLIAIEIEEQPPHSFKDQLASWAVSCGVPHVHINKLLSVLKSHPCHSDLPVDARSLLKTKRNVSLIPMHPGEYYHFDLLNGLKVAIDKKILPRNRNAIEIEIIINVDGLPIFSNSTSKQLWVILGIIRGIDGLEKYPFIIGIYFGLEKPTGGPNTFLRALVNDIKDVLEHGFFHCERLFSVRGIIFVCDSPARAFVSGVKYHSGKNSCSKCTIVGFTALKPSELRRLVRPKGRVVFPCVAAPRRDNESFRQRDDPEHHNYYSIIEELELVDMVNDFPVDPMHLVHEGAAQKLIMLFMEDSDYKISPISVRRVNENMEALSKFTPRDFARRARKFSSKMKATEWAQAIGYTAPVVFRNRLSAESYANLLSLHVAVKILTSKRLCYTHNAYAKDLLKVFVMNSSILYGNAFVSYNIHNLIHLSDDVMRFGPIYSFSAYAFENFLGIIKRLLRKSERPLQQIVKRLYEVQVSRIPMPETVERTCPLLKLPIKGGILLPGMDLTTPQFGLLNLPNFELTTECGDNCVMMSDKNVVKVVNFVMLTGIPHLIGRKFAEFSNLYPAPFDSTMLGIYKCKMSLDLDFWPAEQCECKMYLMPIIATDEFAVFPIENL